MQRDQEQVFVAIGVVQFGANHRAVIWRAKFNQQTFRSSRSQSHGAFDGFDAIALAQNNNTRLPIFRFFFADAGKVHNGQQIAFLAQIRDGAVQNDFAGAALAAFAVAGPPRAAGARSRRSTPARRSGARSGTTAPVRRRGAEPWCPGAGPAAGCGGG